MEWRISYVEDIVGDMAKTIVGLEYFCLKFDESQRILEEVKEMRILEQFIEHE
jgi:hypothetical protein